MLWVARVRRERARCLIIGEEILNSERTALWLRSSGLGGCRPGYCNAVGRYSVISYRYKAAIDAFERLVNAAILC